MNKFKNGNSTDEYWKKKLTKDQYYILRLKGTERPFSGEYYDHFESGIYSCAGCGQQLFRSSAKFKSGCGWPSFFEPVDPNAVKEQLDTSHGMIRTEIVCSNCGGHLGHVFEDGPKDKTGLRYCINSTSLKFEKKVKENNRLSST
ncbi:MAG: peptide-methionine (R)-S-oxide reductase MsrB [Candidatus Heimdallarchaeaceae archaeon]